MSGYLVTIHIPDSMMCKWEDSFEHECSAHVKKNELFEESINGVTMGGERGGVSPGKNWPVMILC